MALENMTCQRHRLLIRCACVLRSFGNVALNGTTILAIGHLVGAEFELDVVHGADFPLYMCIILYVQVGACIQGSTLDQASSVIGALKNFEGALCVDHKIQKAMKHASKSNFISGVEKSWRGIIAHFRTSAKVMEYVYIGLLPTVLLIHFILLSQAMSKLQELSPTNTRPNQGSVTRWVA